MSEFESQSPDGGFNIYQFQPKECLPDADAEKAKEDLVGSLRQLLAMAMSGELQGLAFCGMYTEQRFSVAWTGVVPLPHMVGYVEFLQQQMIASAYIGGIDRS